MKSLKTKLVLIISILSAVAVGIIGMLATETVIRHLDTQIEATLLETAENAAEQVNAAIQSEFEVLHTLSLLPNIIDENVPLQEKCTFLATLRRDDRNIAFYDVEGRFINAAGKPVQAKVDESEYLKPTLRQGLDFSTDPQFSKIGNRVLMFLSVPVKSKDGKIIGCIVSAKDGSVVTSIADSISVAENFHPVIISNKTGEILSNVADEIKNNEKYLAEYTKLIQNIANDQKMEVYNDGITGKKMLAVSSPVPGKDWKVVCSIPYSYYYSSVNALRLIILLIGLAADLLNTFIIYFIISKSLKPLITVKKSFEKISSGDADLTQRIELKSEDEIGQIIREFNKFTEKLQVIIAGIKNSKKTLEAAGTQLQISTMNTSSAITQISANISSTHEQINTSSNAVVETASTLNEISEKINSFDRIIENQAGSVNSASAATEEMVSNIASVKHSMDVLASSFRDLYDLLSGGIESQKFINEKIQKIENQSKALEEANKVINGIASQTNLLAMNAAIEAAHAGEAGKGFSVVADEIRKLSENSTSQSKYIKDNLSDISKTIGETVAVSNDANSKFSSIGEKIKDTNDFVAKMKEALEEQNKGSQQVSQALQSMLNDSSQVETSSVEIAKSNERIMQQIQNLQVITKEITQNMEEMDIGTKRINDSGMELETVSKQMAKSIDDIGSQIDKFKV